MTNASQRKFFAAANTQNGFKSFFEEIFFAPDIECRYIIKGGPGTGKSSFMRKIGKEAEAEGLSVEWYYCSSDTSSLDGVIIDGRVAIFDGTAPHSYDTVLPGAVDQIINLGEFWNAELLCSHRKELEALVGKKSRAYSDAYGYLRAAGELADTVDGVVLPCVKSDKLKNAAARLVGTVTRVDAPCRQVRQVSAFGTGGKVRFDTLEAASGNRVYIEDYYGTAYLLLGEICAAAAARGLCTQVSFDVPSTEKISELYLPDIDKYFGILPDGAATDEYKTVNMKRFVDCERLGDIRFEVRTAYRAYEKLIDLASSALRRAGAFHAAMEKYYIIAMDFERMGEDRMWGREGRGGCGGCGFATFL